MSGADNSNLAERLAEAERHAQQLEARMQAQAADLTLLRTRFARYEKALRGSQVTVYTQDRNLRYTSISNPMYGRSIEDILGRADEEILPAESAAAVIAMKRDALASGEPARAEVSFEEASGAHWHDLHVEPLRNDAGEIVGLTCASIDVTERKDGEAHLRLLLRELTHRSKNLLAVIQGMARQTAKHVGSIDGFLKQFGARLQALAASHDLLVRQSWYGASLDELIRSQIAHYSERGSEQVTVAGPDVALKAEAAQNLGLALHELAANAAKFGALSVPEGRLAVVWQQPAAGEAVALDWHEQSGPQVKPRRKKGFGTMVIERNLMRALGAEVTLDFAPDGLRCHIVIPAIQMLTER